MNLPVTFILKEIFEVNGKKHEVSVYHIKLDKQTHYFHCIVDDHYRININPTNNQNWQCIDFGPNIFASAIGEIIERAKVPQMQFFLA